MERTSIADLKAHLSAYLRKVKAGETVLVLDRGRPVARIEPISGPAAANEHIARLAAAGLARLPTHPVPMDLLRSVRPKSKKSVLEALLEERAEGR